MQNTRPELNNLSFKELDKLLEDMIAKRADKLTELEALKIEAERIISELDELNSETDKILAELGSRLPYTTGRA